MKEAMFWLCTEEDDGQKSMDQKRQVYRLLRKGEITRDLLNEDVYILWPDDGSWYQATVIKVRCSRACCLLRSLLPSKACLHIYDCRFCLLAYVCRRSHPMHGAAGTSCLLCVSALHAPDQHACAPAAGCQAA